MPPLIHPSAQISTSACIQENVWVQALSYIGPRVKLEFNSQISINAKINCGVEIHKSAWIGNNSTVHHDSIVGSHSIVGDDIKVLPKTIIGRQVRLDITCDVSHDLKDHTFCIKPSNLYGEILNLTRRT